MNISLKILVGLCSCSLAAFAADKSEVYQKNWPAWRGPLDTGVAPKANPPTEWSESKNVKWKVPIAGEGSASPIVWEDKVFVLTAIPTGKKAEGAAAPAQDRPAPPPGGPPGTPPGGGGGFGGKKKGGFGGGGMSSRATEPYKFTVICLDRKTGKVLWQQSPREELPHEGRHQTGSFASGSPVTDGKVLVASFGSRGIFCFDLNGKQLWAQDLGKMTTKNGFGEGTSPVIHGDKVIVNWDHENGSFIAALDKNTGKVLWKTPREERTSWATPLLVEHKGKVQVIQNATSRVRSYDLATGKLIWECGGQTDNAIPSPVAAGEMVYIMSGFRGSMLQAINLNKASGNIDGTDAIVWTHNKSTPYVPSPMLYGNNLFFFSVNNPILSCFDIKTGKPTIDAERLEGIRDVYASPVGAGDRVYLTGRSGTTLVIKNSPKLEKLATNVLDDPIDASPAVVGNEIFLRGKSNLYCIAEK
jgi:outer membrane protein assembly factor BamB